LPVWALALPACQQLLGYDPARCQQSVGTVRQAIALEQFESARQWRDYTWRACNDDDRAVVATLDKEILDAETAADAKIKATQQAQQLAQQRINAAQAAWRAFDASKVEDHTQEALDATRKSAKRLEAGLPAEFAQKIATYNAAQYEKRLAALGR
jgi:phytoene dehydrogenase-like protein